MHGLAQPHFISVRNSTADDQDALQCKVLMAKKKKFPISCTVVLISHAAQKYVGLLKNAELTPHPVV